MEIPEEIERWLEKEGGIEKIIDSIPEDETLENKSREYGALSDPVRLKTLHLLSLHPMCVCLLKEALNIADSRLSYHLSILKEAGLVHGKRVRNWVIYSISEKGLEYINK